MGLASGSRTVWSSENYEGKKKNQEYHDFLYHWFEDNIWEGLPSKNINTTTPLLTLAEFNDDCKNPEFEKLCLKWADWLMNCLPRTTKGPTSST